MSDFCCTFARGYKNGALAQLVEHRTENPCVPGSIPGGTTPPFIDLRIRVTSVWRFFYIQKPVAS